MIVAPTPVGEPGTAPWEALLDWFRPTGVSSRGLPPWDSCWNSLAADERDASLVVWAYACCAAAVEPALQPRLRWLELLLDIPPAFPPYCAARLRTLDLPQRPFLSAAAVLYEPPEWLEESVGQWVGDFLREQPRRPLRGLQSAAFEHPEDRALLNAVRAIPVAGQLAASVADRLARAEVLQLMASACAVTPTSLPQLYRTYRSVCEVLDVATPPPLYVQIGLPDAYTVGADSPAIVITHSAVALFDERELAFVLGHELGHILAEHVRFHLVARALKNSLSGAVSCLLGLGDLAVRATLGPTLFAWYRRSELTADRAGYLACQDRAAALRVMMKLAGFPPPYYHQMNPEELLRQHADYQDATDNSIFDRLADLMNSSSQSHPFAVLRARALNDWLVQRGPDAILRDTPEQLAERTASRRRDASARELFDHALEALTQWASRQYACELHPTRIIVREVVERHGSFHETPLESLRRISFVARRVSVDQIHYELDLLTVDHGQPTRVRIPVPFPSKWDQAPTTIRHALLQATDRHVSDVIYPPSAPESVR